MSDVEPTPTIPGSFYASPASDSPVVPALPSAVRSIVRKYTNPAAWSEDDAYAKELSAPTTNPQAVAALRRLDTRKVVRGGNPYSSQESARGIRAASTNAPATPERETSLVENLTNDFQSLVTSIPKIGAMLYEEGRALPDISKTNLSNPLNLARAPGFRMLPGSFILGEFADGGEGFSGLAKHPLYTALDVLPFAESAAGASKTVRLAREIADPVSEALGQNVRVKPIQTFLTHVSPGEARFEPAINPLTRAPFDEALGLQQLAPNALGRAQRAVNNRVAQTRVGQAVREAFGAPTRAMGEVANDAMNTEYFARIENPELANTPGRVYAATRAELKGLSVADNRTLYDTLVGAESRDAFLSALPDNLRDYGQRYLELSDELRADQIARGELVEVPFAHGSEYLPASEAKSLLSKRAVQSAVVNRAQRAVFAANPEILPEGAVDFAHGEIPQLLRGEVPSYASRESIVSAVQANLALLDNLGYDTGAIRELLKGRDTKGKLAYIADEIANTNLTRRDTTAFDSLLDDIGKTRDPKVAVLRDQLSAKQFNRAAKTLRELRARKTFGLDLDYAAIASELKTRAKVQQTLADLNAKNWNAKSLKAAEKALSKADRSAMPGRYAAQVRARANEAFLKDVEVAVTSPAKSNRVVRRLERGNVQLVTEDMQRVQDILQSDLYHKLEEIAPDLTELYADYYTDARKSWQDLAAEGVDPVYVHTVTAAQARAMRHPFIYGDRGPNTPTSARVSGKSIEQLPTVPNLALALTHHAHELLLNNANAKFIEFITNNFTVPADKIIAQYQPIAERMARASGRGVADVLNEIVTRDYVEYKPGALVGKPELSQAFAHKRVLIPRDLNANLQRLIPRDPSMLAKIAGTPMTVFRTAVLPLSPRWHLNNIISGAILTSLVVGPGALPLLREAWQMARSRGVADIPHLPGSSALADAGKWGRETLAGIERAPISERLAVAQGYYAGRAGGKLLNSVAKTLGDRGISWIENTTRAGSAVVEKSYNFNALFDDFYRSIGYLYGKDRALTKGMTVAQAERAGVELSRNIMQNWDRMTPIERGVIRNIMPFYSWAAHVIRFMGRYPADHPWRLSVTSRLADIEYNDHLSGVPQNLRDMLFFGDFKDGRAVGISVSGFSPFRDIANYPALIGFLTGQEGGNLSAVSGQVNPFIGAALQSLGIDPVAGPDLYPDLEYDPSTGGLRVATGNFPVTLAGSMIPQVRSISDLLGWNQEFRALAQTNPEAAARRLQSGFGLPVLARPVDMDEAQIKAEVLRYRQQSTEKAEALKSGNIDALDRWPELRAMADKIRGMTPEQRQQYTPNVQPNSLLDLIKAGLGQRSGV